MEVWIFGIALVIGAVGWVVREVRSRAAQSWPIVQGTVEMHTVRMEGYGRHQREIAEVNYSYSVEGEYYSGAHEVGSESEFEYFPKLSRVMVHYKSSDPAISFLDRDDVRTKREMRVGDAV